MKYRLTNAVMWSVALVGFLYWLQLEVPELSFLLTAGIQFVAVFLGFFLSYWFTTERERQASIRTQEKEQERSARVERFSLGLLWHELRINKNVLRQIKNNFRFAVKEEYLRYSAAKMELLSLLAEKIEDKFYVANQNSGAITEIKSDDVYNDIAMAYENCKYLKINLLIATHDFKLKYTIFTDPGISEKVGRETRDELLRLAREKLPQTESEINAAYITVNKALGTVDTRLNTLGVKAELVERPL